METRKDPHLHAYAFESSPKAESSQVPVLTAAKSHAIKASLEQLVPQSLPLLRRLYLFPTTPTSLLLSTFPLSEEPAAWPRTFCIGFFDRSGAPAVDAWVLTHLDIDPATRTPEEQQLAAESLISFVRFLAVSPFATAVSALDGSTADASVHLLLGAVSEHLRPAMLDHPALAHMIRHDLYSPGGPYAKFVFATDNLRQRFDHATLPSGMAWGTVGDADYALVMATNDILKSSAMVRALPSACIRHVDTGDMVAWGFVGPDGCVRSLYCLPEWRGHGLARLVVIKLHLQPPLVQADDSLGQADAADSNTGSVALFKSLGAKRTGAFYWMRLDLQRLEN